MRATGKLWVMSTSVIAMASAMPAQAQQASGSSDTGGSGDQEIVVTGLRASIAASLAQKKNSDLVSEVITAQDIGKFPDKNVADSLGRLTGVNVVTGSAAAGGFGENQSVSIRGTDPALNLTLLDGHSVATGDWFVLDQTSGGRSFNYSMLPSEIVGRLEVYKSAEADLPEGAIGGTVNVHSRMPLDLPKWSVNVTGQGVHNDLAGGWQPQFSGVVSWKNPQGTLGVLVSGFYEKRDFRRDGQEFLGYASATNFNGSGQTVSFPTLIGNSYFRQQRVRKGGDVAIQWKPSDRLEIVATGLYTRMDANNVNTNSMAWVNSTIGNNSTPGTPGYALKNYTTATYNGITYLTAASWAGVGADGVTPVNGKVQDDIFREAYSSSWVANLEAKWRPTDALTLTGELGYTEGKGATSDTEAWETYWHTGMSYAFNGQHADLAFPNLPADTTSAAYLNNYYSYSWGGRIVSPDREFYAKADAEYALDTGWLKSIKVGGRYTNHKRALNYDAYSWAGNALYSGTTAVNLGTVFAGDVTPGNYSNNVAGAAPYSLANRDLVLQVLARNGGRQFAFYPPQSFSVKEKTAAVYAMAKLGNDRDWRGNIGVRAVHTDLATTQYSPNAPALTITNQFGSFGPVNDGSKYWDVLPSANLTYNITEKLLVRGAVAKVMARPGYAQLAGAFSLNDLGLTGTAGGNPHLNPYRAWQYNLTAEFYYAPQALFSVGVFALDIQNYITSATTTQFYRTQQHPAGANFLVTAPINGGGGFNKGVEVNWQQPIAWGFGVIANYTYSDAKKNKDAVTAADNFSRVIDGNSKHTYNITGYFENKLLSARLAYSFRSKFRSGIDRSTEMWQDNYGQLDGSLLVNVTPHVALSFDAQNLTGSKLYYFVGDKSVPRAYYDNGRTFYAGARLSF